MASLHIAPLRQYRQLAGEIAALLHEEWQSLPPWSDRDAIERRFLNSSGVAAFPYTLVALSDSGEFAGTASIKLRELDQHPDKECWLGEVFVRKDLRRRRLGQLLVNAATRYAFDCGAATLYLYTPDQQKFYAGLGWFKCAQDVVYDEVVTIMVRYRDP